MAEFGLPYTRRSYQCTVCGHEQMIGTNHTGECLDHCGGCSWRGGLGEEGVYHPGYRLFRYVGDEPEDKMIDRDLLGEADALLPKP